MGGSASPRGDQGTGTQGAGVGRPSRLVDVDRELRATDHQLVPDFRQEPREAPTHKLASEKQAVPPLISAALRGMPHCAAERDSASRRSPFPGPGVPLPGSRPDLPGLRSHLPGLSASLPGFRPDLTGLSAPLAGTCLHFEGKADCCLEVKTDGL